MNLPYINLPQSQAPQILGDIGDTLVAAAKRRQDEQAAAAKALLERQQMEATAAHMRAEEARAQAEASRQASYATREEHHYQQQQQQNTANALPEIRKLLTAGDEGSAQAMAQAYGIGMAKNPLPPMPGAAPQAPQAGPAGPIPTPEQRFMGTEGTPDGGQLEQVTEDQKMQRQREQYAQALADHPRLTAEHAQRLEAFNQAKANPSYQITTPFGMSDFNPGEIRAQHQARQEQLAAQLSKGFSPEYRSQIMAQIMADEKPGDVATSVRLQQKADEDHRLKQLGLDQQLTRGQRYEVSMAGANSRGTLAQHADDRQGRSQFHADITKDAATIQKEFRAPYDEARNALAFVDSAPNNPEAWIAARDFFVKSASGGKVTKAQYDQAAAHGAPAYDKLNQIFESVTTGLPSETQRKNLRSALAAIEAAKLKGLQEKSDELDSAYGQDPLVAGGDKLAGGTYQRHKKRLFGDVPKPETRPKQIQANGKVFTLQPDGSYQ